MGRYLIHFGTKRHSGRYPWGSGKDPHQRSMDFMGQYNEYKRMGMGDTAIAEAMKIPTSQLRALKTIAIAEKRAADSAQAIRLKDTGMSNVAIGREMGINESSVRALLDPVLQERSNAVFNTAKILRDTVDKKRFVDIGAGMEQQLGVTRTKLNAAVDLLREDGYQVFYDKVRQLGTDKNTSLRVLAGPNESRKEFFREHRDKVRMIDSYTEDGGLTWTGIEPVKSVNRNRILVKYDEDGGSKKDGVIELRRGVEDLSLGNSHYAQVRIAVDGTHYMKGMAMYANEIPNGYDIIYNTNKKRGTPDTKVFKPIKKTKEDDPNAPIDESNPFGAVIRQKHYIDANGKKQLSPLNIVGSPEHPGSGEEGSWMEWSRTLSSQVLSKQTSALARKQLGEALTSRQEEFDEIMSLTNPAVKKRLLETFADSCDSAAVHLKAAAMPGQASHVLLPFPSIKENEVFAPRYNDGDVVVLIRHPHGGTFEIPQLIVNNKNKEAIAVLGRTPKDAVGIHPKVAEKLSGADFDGDTVLVIPNNKGEIRTSPTLKGLENFAPRERYKEYPGMKLMTPQVKAREMGDISNLITDMTIKGAKEDELARAVRHSMVVIDAEKHKLNWKLSAEENNIAELKTKYQGGPKRGASTLVSRASSTVLVPKRKPGYKIDPKTGQKIWENANETYVKSWSYVKDPMTGKYVIDPSTGERVKKQLKNPKVLQRTQSSTKMYETEDAYTLSSGTRMETIYANHANGLKALGNKARLASVQINDTPYSPAAREVYHDEVASLRAKLNLAYRNKPYERQAQLIANKEVEARVRENPSMDDDHVKKIKGQALTAARHRVGAKKEAITITDREWEAIQAGAITKNALREILLNTDLDLLKQRSMPRNSVGLSSARVSRAKAMEKNGATTAEIAQALGVSASVVERALQ